MRLACLALVLAAVAGLAQTPGAKIAVTDFSPKPEDAKKMRGAALVERWNVAAGKLELAGNLPTPCHELRVKLPEKPGAGGELAVEAYSVFDPRSICAQMLRPFTVSIALTAPQAAGKVILKSE